MGIVLNGIIVIISVVGNAQSIFSKRNGHLIDMADEVIRFNNGRIVHPTSQGRKTTIFAYSYCRKNIKYLPKDVKYWSIIDDEDLFKEREYLQEILDIKPSNGIIVLEKLKNDYPLDKIHIFGFDWKRTRTWYHRRNLKEGPAHDYKKEKEYCIALIHQMGWRLF